MQIYKGVSFNYMPLLSIWVYLCALSFNKNNNKFVDIDCYPITLEVDCSLLKNNSFLSIFLVAQSSAMLQLLHYKALHQIVDNHIN